jgi:AcrR family transcriptional regulator
MALTNLGTERALLEQRRHRKMTACGRPALESSHGESLRMAKPLIPVDVIYEHALALIDAEGAQALNARRLAADLRCSTRTLYQQVGNREELIRALIDRHFSQLQLDFHEYDSWESTAVQWSLALDDALQAHPFLTELMNVDDRGAVTSYVNKLLKKRQQSYLRTIDWIVAGVRQESLSATTTGRRR